MKKENLFEQYCNEYPIINGYREISYIAYLENKVFELSEKQKDFEMKIQEQKEREKFNIPDDFIKVSGKEFTEIQRTVFIECKNMDNTVVHRYNLKGTYSIVAYIVYESCVSGNVYVSKEIYGMAKKEKEKVKNFLNDILKVCKEYGYSLSHEDMYGGFAVVNYNKKNNEWLKDASIELTNNFYYQQ